MTDQAALPFPVHYVKAAPYNGERIAVAACRGGPGGKVYAVGRPGRHGDVFKGMEAHGVDYFPQPDDQGFVTNKGRFVGRIEARDIAVAAGQLLPRASAGPELYSECVW